MYRVVPKAEISILDQHTFQVNYNEECTGIRKEYEVFLGKESKFCCCSYHDFCCYHMFCNHFFTILNSNLAKLDNLSPFLQNHADMTLDHNMFININETVSPSWKDETTSNKMEEQVDKLNNEFCDNTDTIHTNHRDDLNMKSSVTK